MRKTLGILSLWSFLVGLAGCGSSPPPFDPRRLEEIQKHDIPTYPRQPLRSLATTLPNPVIEKDGKYEPAPRPRPLTRPVGPVVKLTLQEVIRRTVVNSLDIRVAGFQPAIDELRVSEEEGVYDPTIFSQFQAQRQFPQGVFPTSLSPNELLTGLLSGGVRVKTPSGGQYELRAQSERYTFSKPLGIFNQSLVRQTIWDDQVVLQVTQPLLKNFGDEVNRAKITIARNDQKTSQLDFRLAVEKQLQNVEEAYWKLFLAKRDVEIQQQLLADTDRTLDVMIRRLSTDTTMLQVAQVQSQAEQRYQTLIEAQRAVGDASDDLKQLMNDPDFLPGSGVTILPASQPVEDAINFMLVDQIDTGFHNRAELMQQIVRIDSARTVIKAAKNNLLPQLNLQGSAGIEGLGNGPGQAAKATYDAQFFDWTIGFQFEIPMGNRVAEAIYRRTVLQHIQATIEYVRLMQQVATDISKADRNLRKYWEQIDVARRSAFAARDALEEFDKIERAGAKLTPELVQLKLQFQEQFANASRQVAQTVAQYNISISALERAKGTILRYNNVVLKEEKGPSRATWEGKARK